MAKKTFRHFLDEVKGDDQLFEALGAEFVLLTPGKWELLIKWLESHDYYTANDELTEILRSEDSKLLLQSLKKVERLKVWANLEKLKN